VTLTVRCCEPRDLSQVRELLVRTWHATYDAIYGPAKVTEITDRWHAIDQLQRQLRAPLSLFLVAEEGGSLIGTSKASGKADGGLRLDRLYVDPAAQGQGVGSMLLAATLDAYPFAKSIELEVEPKNHGALDFYRRRGFDVAGAVGDCGGDSGVAARTMRRYLQPRAAGAGHVMVRPVRDADAQDLVGLIGLCFAEYPGCYFDPHGDMPDIVRPSQSPLAREGLFLAVEDETGRVCACAGVDFPDAGVAELHRLYVRPDARGRGLAKLLTRRLEDFARQRGAVRMTMWSDTRFTKAHTLYTVLGYATGATRSLGDISLSREFYFERTL
jgi:ribosomal protein S18 acetylase RimI-like enzyme